MNKQISITLVMVLCFLGFGCASTSEYKPKDFYSLQTEATIPISISKFNNKAAESSGSPCRGWLYFGPNLGDAFVDTTIEELSHFPKLEVLERDTIHQINQDEVNLVNSEKSTPIEKGHFKKAKYTIVGTVNSFEYCDGKNGIGLGSLLSDYGIGAHLGEEKTTVGVLMRLVDTKTGRVVATASGSGEQTRRRVSGNFAVGPQFDLGGTMYKQSSLAGAIREAIHNGTNELLKKASL